MAVVDLIPALFDNYFIKLVFLVHATFIGLASIFFMSNANLITYTSYNLIFIFCVLQAILVDKSVDIVLVATVFNVICIFLDILLLITGNYIGLLATLLVVFNLIARPASTILLLKNYCARAGVEDPTGALEVNVTEARPRSAYQNIDEPNQTLP